MRFLVDAQLPPALARWLVANGHTAEHVADRQMEAASDAAIWDCALQEAAAIITKERPRRSCLASVFRQPAAERRADQISYGDQL